MSKHTYPYCFCSECIEEKERRRKYPWIYYKSWCPCCLRVFEEERKYCWDCGEVKSKMLKTKKDWQLFLMACKKSNEWAEAWFKGGK